MPIIPAINSVDQVVRKMGNMWSVFNVLAERRIYVSVK